MATKLQFTENFTIEVPKKDGTFDEIKGKVLAQPDTAMPTKNVDKDMSPVNK